MPTITETLIDLMAKEKLEPLASNSQVADRRVVASYGSLQSDVNFQNENSCRDLILVSIVASDQPLLNYMPRQGRKEVNQFI